MILEGLVTTRAADGSMHVAPMGPRVDAASRHFTLKPFATSTTYRNLVRHGEGVLHVTDDVLMLAKAAVGRLDPPPHAPAELVSGFVLTGACRAFEFRVTRIDGRSERIFMEAEMVRAVTLRDFFGFNRGKHAVLEAAILATRLHLLPAAEVAAEFVRLKVLVDKTGGAAEHEAFAFLDDYRAAYRPPEGV